MKQLPNKLFVLLVVGVLAAGLFKTIAFPKAINKYENRTAEKVPSLTLEGIAEQTFQDGLEAALGDQVFGAESMKKGYNSLTSGYLRTVLTPALNWSTDGYLRYKDVYYYGGENVVFAPETLERTHTSHTAKAENFNAIIRAHPELDFYTYYIERDLDINFETGEKVGIWSYLDRILELPSANKGVFRIDNFREFKRDFYRTDHHWNHVGSYRAYTELLSLLQVGEEPLQPLETVKLSSSYSGSKNRRAGGGLFNEDFNVYRFDFPEMTVRCIDPEATDYGRQEEYLSGQGTAAEYGSFYGWDDGEIIFDTGRTDRKNILILGESYDNAILKLVASHYNVTCSVDLRNYSYQTGKDFSFSQYVKEHEIDQVLFIGNAYYFSEAEFTVTD